MLDMHYHTCLLELVFKFFRPLDHQFLLDCQCGNLEDMDLTFKKLIKFGLGVDSKNKKDMTGLHWATQGGHENVVEFLLEKGATVNLVNKIGMSPLHIASRDGHLGIIKLLLNTNEVDIEAECDDCTGSTPLILAAEGGHLKILELFHSKGVKLNTTDNIGHTALNKAEIMGHRNIVEYLKPFM